MIIYHGDQHDHEQPRRPTTFFTAEFAENRGDDGGGGGRTVMATAAETGKGRVCCRGIFGKLALGFGWWHSSDHGVTSEWGVGEGGEEGKWIRR